MIIYEHSSSWCVIYSLSKIVYSIHIICTVVHSMKDKGADRGVLVISLLFGLSDCRGSSYFLHWIDNKRSTHLKRACHETREWLSFEYQMSSELSVTTNIFLLKPKCFQKIGPGPVISYEDPDPGGPGTSGPGRIRIRYISSGSGSGSRFYFCWRKNMYNFCTACHKYCISNMDYELALSTTSLESLIKTNSKTEKSWMLRISLG